MRRPRPSQGRTYRAPGGTTLRLMLDESNLGAEASLGELTFPPNSDSGEHTHGAIEIFYVVTGELEHVVNGSSQLLKPGMAGFVKPPDRVRHKTGPAGAKVWWCGCRAKRAAASPPGGSRSNKIVPHHVRGTDAHGRRPRRSTSFARSSTRIWRPASTTAASRRGFRPSPTATCTSATPRRSASTSASPREFGGTLQPALRRHQPGQGRRRVRRLDQGRRRAGSASTGTTAVLRVGLLRAALRSSPSGLIRKGAGLRRQPDGRRDPRVPRHADRAGHEQPVPRPAVEENLDLFRRMRAGEFADGAHVLRAKIDMASPNINMRDPVLYRIRHATHHRTGDAWCIYPMYDYAHPLSDAIEGITHSLCTLEFEDHRPLYDWLRRARCIDGDRPQQIEFARLNLNYTVMSKRKLLQLVEQRHVVGLGRSAHADARRAAPPRLHAGIDPRLLRAHRRGQEGERHRRRRCSSTACARISTAARRASMAVLRPLKVVLTNYPGGPGRGDGRRQQPRGRRRPARARCRSRASSTSSATTSWRTRRRSSSGWRPGREVRLRYAYLITCTEVVKDAAGEIVELRCTYDPATRGGDAPDGRKVKATLHWVSAAHARRRRGAALRSAVHRRGSRARGRAVRSPITSTRPRSRCSPAASSSRAWPAAAPGRRVPVRAAGLLLRRSRFHAGSARLQPHGLAAGRLGQNRAAAAVEFRNSSCTAPRVCQHSAIPGAGDPRRTRTPARVHGGLGAFRAARARAAHRIAPCRRAVRDPFAAVCRRPGRARRAGRARPGASRAPSGHPSAGSRRTGQSSAPWCVCGSRRDLRGSDPDRLVGGKRRFAQRENRGSRRCS